MASACKRMRLSPTDNNDDDDDDDDVKLVIADVRNDDNTPSGKVAVKTETAATPAAGDDVDANSTTCLTLEQKPNVIAAIDLTVDSPPRDTRRQFPQTAEVIKARYTHYIMRLVILKQRVIAVHTVHSYVGSCLDWITVSKKTLSTSWLNSLVLASHFAYNYYL